MSGPDLVQQDRIFMQALHLFLPSSQEYLWLVVLPAVCVSSACCVCFFRMVGFVHFMDRWDYWEAAFAFI